MRASKIKIAVFASGRGSNAENIFKHIKEKLAIDSSFNIEVCCLVTDKENAGVIGFAKEYKIPFKEIPFSVNKAHHENEIKNYLSEFNPDYLFLCGYMRILSEDFINTYTIKDLSHSSIVNIHPSLLPAFPGKDGYGDAFKSNVTESGVTIHFVDKGVDTGPIIMQKSFPRHKDDSLDEFKARGLKLEHEMYRELINQLSINGDFDYVFK